MANDRRCTELCHRRDGACSGCIGIVVAVIAAGRPGSLWLLPVPVPGMRNAGCCAATVVMSGIRINVRLRGRDRGRQQATFLCPRLGARSTCGCWFRGICSGRIPNMSESASPATHPRAASLFSEARHAVCVVRSQSRTVGKPRANGTAPEIEMASASLSSVDRR